MEDVVVDRARLEPSKPLSLRVVSADDVARVSADEERARTIRAESERRRVGHAGQRVGRKWCGRVRERKVQIRTGNGAAAGAGEPVVDVRDDLDVFDRRVAVVRIDRTGTGDGDRQNRQDWVLRRDLNGGADRDGAGERPETRQGSGLVACADRGRSERHILRDGGGRVRRECVGRCAGGTAPAAAGRHGEQCDQGQSRNEQRSVHVMSSFRDRRRVMVCHRERIVSPIEVLSRTPQSG